MIVIYEISLLLVFVMVAIGSYSNHLQKLQRTVTGWSPLRPNERWPLQWRNDSV